MLFGDYKPKTKTVNFMCLDGGVGDHIGSLVAIDYAIKTNPWITPLVWCPDYFVELAKHLILNDVSIRGYSDMRFQYNPNYPTKTTKWDGVFSPMKIHTVDYAFMKLCDENPGPEHKNYLQIRPDEIDVTTFDIPKDYAVVTTGFTAAVREWPAKEVNEVVRYLLSKNITPVFLGSTAAKTGGAHVITGVFKEEIDLSVGINLIDKTSLLYAARIMSGARAVLGVDNGLLHVAACTQVPIIAGFTTVTPEARMPYRNGVLGWNYHPIVPDDSLECKFCQVRTNFLYGHDYRNCLFKGKNPEKHNLCTRQMTATKFISKLESLAPIS